MNFALALVVWPAVVYGGAAVYMRWVRPWIHAGDDDELASAHAHRAGLEALGRATQRGVR